MLLTWFWEIVKIFSAFTFSICGALRDLVLFVQFKKREKHPQRSVNFSKAAGWSIDKLFLQHSWREITQMRYSVKKGRTLQFNCGKEMLLHTSQQKVNQHRFSLQSSCHIFFERCDPSGFMEYLCNSMYYDKLNLTVVL